MASTWQHILAYATGKDVSDHSVHTTGKLTSQLSNYTSKFDSKLNDKWDEQTDAAKVKERKEKAQEMTNAYYDIATDFYEYGWGQSFHFATRYEGEGFDQSLARHEHYLALRLNLQAGEKCVDIGCGVGGPLREIARFTQAHITGITINSYQVKRALRLNEQAGLSSLTQVIQGDFMALPFPANSMDKAYAIEATCHAPDRTGCYRQAFEVLKEGGLFGGFEWTMTDKYDPKNEWHNRCKHGIEIGNSLPTLTHYSDIVAHLKAAGFEIIEHFDLALVPTNGTIPWYASFLGGLTLSQFKHTSIGRMCTNNLCWAMETVGLAPKGTFETAALLGKTGDALAESGRLGIFTPMYFFLARKPFTAEKNVNGGTGSKKGRKQSRG